LSLFVLYNGGCEKRSLLILLTPVILYSFFIFFVGEFMSGEQLKLELNKIALSQAEHDVDLRHKWEQESHWRSQC